MKAGVLTATVGAAALLVAGCGGAADRTTAGRPTPTSSAPSTADHSGPSGRSTPSGSPSAGPGSPSESALAGPTRCHTSELTASLRPQGAAAGNRYATLVLTNHTAHTCRIYGYGGLGLLDAQHHAIVTHQYRNPAHPPVLVTVTPGHSASTLLHWGVVPAGAEQETGPCEPQPSFLSVIPPDETDPLVVAWPDGPVCQQGRIDQWAYAAGISLPDQ